MLTLEYILKIARLRDQMGDLRPGFIHDQKSNLKGPHDSEPVAPPPVRYVRSGKVSRGSMKPKYRLVHKVDPTSGDVRIVQQRVVSK